jgi:CRISPR-associated protein Cas1
LNYGYSIIRSAIRRELVLHGFEPSLGINHSSNENPFNLSDDIIEPYRPFVDAIVLDSILSKETESFTEEDKKILIEEILTSSCRINEKVYYLYDAIKETVESLMNCYRTNTASGIHLPKLIEP